ncbi:conserved hypothetical protein [Kribbella flavida DSM 17836]|uniref:Integral membrane protein n=1 Tax=Kribbella flavida (strain DSM 17836 / JCM 10339 / NBRC 14399) TaxID=479435 RepID=D2Q4W5_KRIFD|nr:hypothetical protein [Kribbella flavida]ADB34220.1 conserved hypothetical protein [Kribbella flavida DSM 17836]
MSTQSITATGTTVQSRSLTQVIRLDAVASGALGVVLLGAGWALDGPLGLPTALSVGAGAFLLAWTAALLLIARGPAMKRTAVLEVIGVNAVWVAASLAALVTVDLTGLGIAFVLAQAAAVGVFTELQVTALRKAH